MSRMFHPVIGFVLEYHTKLQKKLKEWAKYEHLHDEIEVSNNFFARNFSKTTFTLPLTTIPSSTTLLSNFLKQN